MHGLAFTFSISGSHQVLSVLLLAAADRLREMTAKAMSLAKAPESTTGPNKTLLTCSPGPSVLAE